MENKTSKRGFTLIELLIVIALLGALAVGLLAAIDPFEQFKKGRDTSIRNTAAEFFNASIRYFSQRNKFPWDTVTELTTGGLTDLGSLTGTINELGNAGELKEDFYELAGGSDNLKNIFLYYPNPEKLVVCFQPQSKAFRNDQNTQYDISGNLVTDGSCPNATSTSCYYCFK